MGGVCTKRRIFILLRSASVFLKYSSLSLAFLLSTCSTLSMINDTNVTNQSMLRSCQEMLTTDRITTDVQRCMEDHRWYLANLSDVLILIGFMGAAVGLFLFLFFGYIERVARRRSK